MSKIFDQIIIQKNVGESLLIYEMKIEKKIEQDVLKKRKSEVKPRI